MKTRCLLFWTCCCASIVNADALPPPYDSAPILPFRDEGWYGHQAFFETYIRRHNVKTIIEVGVWLGKSACHMAKCLPDDGVIYAVDHWLGCAEQQPGQSYWSPVLPKAYEYFLSNVIQQGVASKIIPVRMESTKAAMELPIQADLIYIDASHDTDSVYADLRAWFPHVKPGGILCGDDWHHPPLRAAVYRFAQEEGLEIELNSVYILRKK